MVYQAVAPITPNISTQAEAVAGNSAVVFTATDRKVIEERSGRIERNRSFMEIFKEKPLTPEVENEETSVKPQQDVKELEGRQRDHKRMLKHSAISIPQEHVEITNQIPDTYENPKEVILEPEAQSLTKSSEDKKIVEQTAAIAKELKLNPAEIFDKFNLEQKELLGLISRVKEMHLRRLLTDQESEFASLSREIEKGTLARAKPEAKAWLEAQLEKLTLDAAKYKLGILKSLQSMELEPNKQREENIKWLKKIAAIT